MFVRGIISDSSDNHSLAVLFFPCAAVGLPEYLRSKTKFFGIVVQINTGSSTFLMGRAADGKAPKSEIRNPKEGRSPKSEKPAKRLGSGYVLNTISKNQRKNQAMPPTKNPASGFGF